VDFNGFCPESIGSKSPRLRIPNLHLRERGANVVCFPNDITRVINDITRECLNYASITMPMTLDSRSHSVYCTVEIHYLHYSTTNDVDCYGTTVYRE
jgi:hypothetical protein